MTSNNFGQFAKLQNNEELNDSTQKIMQCCEYEQIDECTEHIANIFNIWNTRCDNIIKEGLNLFEKQHVLLEQQYIESKKVYTNIQTQLAEEKNNHKMHMKRIHNLLVILSCLGVKFNEYSNQIDIPSDTASWIDVELLKKYTKATSHQSSLCALYIISNTSFSSGLKNIAKFFLDLNKCMHPKSTPIKITLQNIDELKNAINLIPSHELILFDIKIDNVLLVDIENFIQ